MSQSNSIQVRNSAYRLLPPFTKRTFDEKIAQFIEMPERFAAKHRYCSEFESWKQDTETLLRHAFGEESRQVYDFINVRYSTGVYYSGMADSSIQRIYKKGLERAVVILQSIRKEVADYFVDESEVEQPNNSQCCINTKRVFVVHGHDETLREKVARTLEKLGLLPIILREQPNEGQTLIEKFESKADVGFAVVLLTPDDIGYDKNNPNEAAGRARQNVVLELGYFVGRIGRKRVMAIRHPDVELPGDVFGLVYTDSQDEHGWKVELVRELKAAGYSVDANKLF